MSSPARPPLSSPLSSHDGAERSKASHWRQKGQMAQRWSDDVDPYQQTENLLVSYSEQKLEFF